MLCSFCTGKKTPNLKAGGCCVFSGLSFPLFLDGRLGPPDRCWAVGVGRRGCAAACQPPAAACVHQMLANQAAPKLPTWLQLQPGLLFTRRDLSGLLRRHWVLFKSRCFLPGCL